MRHVLLPCAALVGFAAVGGVARADDFLQAEGDLWRASKLVGVAIYGPGMKKVGEVSDVLMGPDGKAGFVVVGVGGFLGIGQKDVAIPFDKVTFTQEPMPVPSPAMPPTTGQAFGVLPGAAAPPAGATSVTTPAGTTAPTAASTGAVAPAGGMTVNPALPRSTAYPDHGTVAYTADQLKAAPTFSFAK